jgi:penicillin amidase
LEVGSGLEALLGLNAAASVEGALNALSGWPCPILNAVVADDRGRIAYHVVGRVPRRAEAARRYRRADDPADAWQGFVDYDELPQLLDPPRGWIASANQPPWCQDPPGLSYLPGGAWADGGRMRRIHQRLTGEGERKYSPAELGAIQADDLSERAVELVPALLRLLREVPRDDAPMVASVPPPRVVGRGTGGAVPHSALVQQAAALLESWDGRFSLESAAPAVWVAFWDAWQRRVAAARFPAHLVALTQGQAGAVARELLAGQDTTPPWFAVVGDGGGDVAGEVRAAFAEGVAWVVRHFGAAPGGWQWGRHHTVTWRHALSEQGPEAQRRAAAALFDVGPFPTTGGVGTVRAAGFSLARPFEVTGGATYRLIADLSPGGGMVATTTTGQSGHPGSPHYADQARLWLDDAHHPFPMDDFEAEGVTTLTPLRLA